MEKIYGYKLKDMIGIVNFIKENPRLNLSACFRAYAQKNGKAQGSVRNLYYAVVKFSKTNGAFRDKYLGGKALCAEKIEAFTKDQELELVKKILTEKQRVGSVRGACLVLGGGNAKLALRMQNKFRNLQAKTPDLIEKISKEVGESNFSPEKVVNRFEFLTLKREIDKLIDRISQNLRRENFNLKQDNCKLKTENFRLRKFIEETNLNKSAIKGYFSGDKAGAKAK